LGPIPKSPIPNPQSPIPIYKNINLNKIKVLIKIYKLIYIFKEI